MDYTDLISSIIFDPAGAAHVTVPEDWMQGRTTYGGLTAALSLKAALPLAGDRPIRSAQVAFVGPSSGELVSVPTLLREGKNTAFISVRMTGAEGVVAECIFAFGAARDSALDFSYMKAPEVTAPDETPAFFSDDRRRPAFSRHFNVRLARGGPPLSGATSGEIALWLRHKDMQAPMDAVSVLALADTPPPAAMSMLSQPAKISSMTWMAEFLTDRITTQDGWFLAQHIAQTARQGYSSQAMRLWNAKGEPVMVGRQTIAVFG
ncbi:MAG: thioesterase family protein [Hyphomonas sp.]|uniref:thioesterase family protein n=1 Tax=Hyphomonas sp. TaxID=87 RepID=UPI003527155F